MSSINSKLVEVTGQVQKVEFEGVQAPYFLIKNLTDDVLYASFDTPIQDDKTNIIPSNFGIVMFVNTPKLYLANDTHDSVYIMGSGAGSVEVMPIWEI